MACLRPANARGPDRPQVPGHCYQGTRGRAFLGHTAPFSVYTGKGNTYQQLVTMGDAYKSTESALWGAEGGQRCRGRRASTVLPTREDTLCARCQLPC